MSGQSWTQPLLLDPLLSPAFNQPVNHRPFLQSVTLSWAFCLFSSLATAHRAARRRPLCFLRSNFPSEICCHQRKRSARSLWHVNGFLVTIRLVWTEGTGNDASLSLGQMRRGSKSAQGILYYELCRLSQN